MGPSPRWETTLGEDEVEEDADYDQSLMRLSMAAKSPMAGGSARPANPFSGFRSQVGSLVRNDTILWHRRRYHKLSYQDSRLLWL